MLIVGSLFPSNMEPTKGVFLKQEARQLNEMGEVKVIAPVPWYPRIKGLNKWTIFTGTKTRETIDGMDVHHPRYLVTPKVGRSLYGYTFFLGIRGIAKKIQRSFDFDLIIGHFAYPDGFAAALLGKALKKPVIIKVLGSDINVFIKGRLRRAMTVYSLKRAQRVIAVSEELKQGMIALGIDGDKIDVIANGVDLEHFRPMDRDECRRKLNLSTDETVVLYIGNLKRIKGSDVLLEAFDKIAKAKGPDHQLCLVGDGYLRPVLEDRVAELGLGSQVQFKGIQPHDSIPLWINACDVLCLPSINEGCPNIILESLACAKPVVASRVGAIPKMVPDRRWGIIVPPGDAEALALGLQEAIDNSREMSESPDPVPLRSWEDVARDTIESADKILA